MRPSSRLAPCQFVSVSRPPLCGLQAPLSTLKTPPRLCTIPRQRPARPELARVRRRAYSVSFAALVGTPPIKQPLHPRRHVAPSSQDGLHLPQRNRAFVNVRPIVACCCMKCGPDLADTLPDASPSRSVNEVASRCATSPSSSYAPRSQRLCRYCHDARSRDTCTKRRP